MTFTSPNIYHWLSIKISRRICRTESRFLVRCFGCKDASAQKRIEYVVDFIIVYEYLLHLLAVEYTFPAY